MFGEFRKDGKHTHACKCGTTWEHGNDCAAQGGEEFYKKAHTCPTCGALVYEGYHGVGMEVNVNHPVSCAPGPVPEEVRLKGRGLKALALLGMIAMALGREEEFESMLDLEASNGSGGQLENTGQLLER